MKQRDTTLDALRGLAMIYIVCVIHLLYWFGHSPEPLSSTLLFEMPAIFFISGAAQSLRGGAIPPLRHYITGRIKRVLLPFYIFIPVLFLWLALVSAFEPQDSVFHADIGSLTFKDIAKILLTAGNANIPYYQYTWFISCYFVLLCLFPLQARILNRVNRLTYMCMWLAVTVSVLSLHTVGYWLKNLFVYNFFFLTGYLFYRRIKLRMLAVIAAVTVILTTADFMAGTAIPMQLHKFPADVHFLVFGTAWLSVLSLALWRVRLPCSGIIALWNTRGYNIFLYQIFGAYFFNFISREWIGDIDSSLLSFTVSFALILTVNTLLSYATYGLEQKVTDTVLRNTKKKCHTKTD